MAKQNYGGVYANMEFPPYEYIPYPRHVITGPKGQFEIAYSEEEERKIKARLMRERDEAPVENEPFAHDQEKEILISRARELGVPINRKWSKEKLKSVVSTAENEIDNLPPEDDYDNFPATVSPETHLKNSFTAPAEEEHHSEEDKDVLIAKAKELGFPATKLWGIPRLKASIAEATAR